jgi:hypothetical protein
MPSITTPIGAFPTVPPPALPELQTGANAAAQQTQTDKETFLKLLVAQLQNQNPADPSDPMQFVTQLAQFTGVEQTIAMRKELESIRSVLEQRLITPETTAAPVNEPLAEDAAPQK